MENSIKKPNKLFNFIRKLFIILSFDKVLRLLTQNRSPHSFVGRLCPNNYQYAKGSFREFRFRGINFKADVSDYEGYYLYFGFKDEAYDRLFKLIKPDDVILDVGSNIGATLLRFATLTAGKVFGFEPDPYNFELCSSNIALNNFNNVFLENIGLGETGGIFNLVVNTPTNRGGNRISFDTNNSKESVAIKVARLDEWIENVEISKIDLIKIDVEGFELKVLKGGINTLKRFKPKLFIELDDNNLRAVNDSAKELILFLESIGYEIMHSTENRHINRDDFFENCHFDIICYPRF